MKVGFVIPVHNAGIYIERPIESILKQSMPQDELEVVLVNDGSTDDSTERLNELAEKTESTRVFPLPNSGWPGRPRNAGVAYPHFLDQDDALGPKAMEVRCDRARKNDSDIVAAGKVKGNMCGPIRLFRESADSVGPEFAELYETLPPHWPRIFVTGRRRSRWPLSVWWADCVQAEGPSVVSGRRRVPPLRVVKGCRRNR
ncbi:glycosyltransferase family A protein [Streptomyces sp. NPDC126497]|uniref:glycosyltransferase family 2 protein n=1 Tax=Streptomyces sp. NPDC126497 TaxID=3155313 RepID=UPI00332E4E4B